MVAQSATHYANPRAGPTKAEQISAIFSEERLWRTCWYESSRDHEAKITRCFGLFASYFLKFIYFSSHLRARARVTRYISFHCALLSRYFSRFDLLTTSYDSVFFSPLFFFYTFTSAVYFLSAPGNSSPIRDKFLLLFPPR